MHLRVLIEFVVEVPNMDVAGDVQTRISREHTLRLGNEIQAITGFQPIRTPGQAGFFLATEPVTWNEAEKDWIGPDDGDDDGDDDDDDE